MPKKSAYYEPNGGEVRRRREGSGLSQADLAEQCLCGVRTVRNVEGGKKCTANTLQVLAAAFRLTHWHSLLSVAERSRLGLHVVHELRLDNKSPVTLKGKRKQPVDASCATTANTGATAAHSSSEYSICSISVRPIETMQIEVVSSRRGEAYLLEVPVDMKVDHIIREMRDLIDFPKFDDAYGPVEYCMFSISRRAHLESNKSVKENKVEPMERLEVHGSVKLCGVIKA